MKKTKTALLHSGLALLLCISMLIGSTFAWFSDSISGGKNVITAGNLDLEMYWTDDLNGEWHNVEENGYNTIFSYDNWEPGYTDVKYIKLVNAGDLALNYKLSLTPQNGVGKLAEVINVYYAEGGVAVEQRDDLKNLQAIGLLNNVLNGGATADGTLLAADQYSPLHPSGEVVMTVAMNMLTTAGNDYMNEDAGLFSIIAIATQAQFEKDSFGEDYDADAQFPNVLVSGSASASVTPVDNKVPAGGVTLSGSRISAYVPEGVVLEDGTTELNLTVTPLKKSASDITAVNNEMLIPVDVHIDGVSENNTVPIVIDLGEILPKYLNMGNYHLYHVEDGTNNEMVLVGDKANLTAHNQYTYDPITGAVSVAMASFSEVTVLSETTAKWKGGEDYTWYNTTDTELNIANADQLHAFSKIVGGMAENVEVDTFSGKTVTLLSDINLNNGTVLEGVQGTTKTIFYPIGYNNNKAFTSENEVNRPTETYTGVTSGVKAFEGTFDGDGHTISNFYQNTWEMFGDYNSGYPANPNYYKDAMGLFAWVDGTVKNLTVDNFKSDGEFTPTGVIAAYAGYNGNAKFENIAITNCNPRVYNTGNGGIVGIGGNEEKENTIDFKNITIDNTNTITALWGSWDVACGGLMGMFRGKDSQNAVVTMDNCHVAAQIDVYNDVCGNYQYYWYRYSGMLIGTNYNMTTENGYTVPNTKQYSATDCTVHFGDWNDYYYCELVANSLASYTHDHQFSRLEEIQNVSEIQDDEGNWSRTGNFILMNGNEPTETCYHIMKKTDGTLYDHKHDVADDTNKEINETVNGETVLKENNQRIYLPFNQLFTGYGWGVKHVPIYDDGTPNPFAGVTILPREGYSTEKFESKFTGDFLYRVGNQNTVSVGSLFAAKEKDELGNSVTISNSGVWVTVEKIDENMNVGGTFTADKSNWTNGKIQFNGTGVVKVTIQDYNYCTPTVLYLEVVEAKNATTATSATSNNVVLLNDVSGTFTVSNNKTVYGNGFKVTLPSGTYQSNYSAGYVGYITMSGGNLDNIRIEGPSYPAMNIFRDQAKDSSDATKANYFYNTILINSGNCAISNSYISGSRSAVCIRGGNNVVIDNSTIYGGAVANIHLASASNVTLRDLTTVQVDATDSYGQNKTVHGMGVFVEAGSTQLNIEGALNQYNWINEAQWTAMVGSYKNQFPDFFTDSAYAAYQHTYNGTTYVNLALIFACEWDVDTFNAENHTNKTEYAVKDGITLLGYTGGIYATANQGSLTEEMVNYTKSYTSTGYDPVAPTFDFDNSANYDEDDEADSADSYCVYNDETGILSIGSTGSAKTLDLSGVQITKAGSVLAHIVYLNGTQVDGNTVTIDKSNGTTQYLKFVASSNDAGYDTNGNPIDGSIVYEWSVRVDFAIVSYAKPEWTMSGISNGTYQLNAKDNNCIWVEYGSTFDKNYGEALPIFEGITAKYYDATGEHTVDFSGITNATNLTADGTTANTLVYKDPDSKCELQIKYTSGWKGNSPNYIVNVYNGTVYVYPKDLTNSNYVKNDMQTFDVKFTYIFKDPNGQTTEQITVNWYDASTYSDITTVQWKTFDSTNGQANTTSCVTGDTLVTLADGSQKELQSVNKDDMFVVWDFYNGQYAVAPALFVFDISHDVVDVIHLHFEDGTTVKVVDEHGFFDADENKFVFLGKNNVADYVGHQFVKMDGDSYTTVKLVNYEIINEYADVYSILTDNHFNAILEGMFTLTAPHISDNFFAPFEVKNNMMYDAQEMQNDITKYGLYEYKLFEDYLTYEQFVGMNIDKLKIAVGKGILTFDEIIETLELLNKHI